MKNKIKFINIICAFILIQPVFDVLVYFLREKMQIDSLLISLIRPSIALLIYGYLFLSNKVSKKIKTFSFSYLVIYCIYALMHLLNIRNYFFDLSDGNLFTEIRYIFNYGYFILQLINYYIIFKITTKEEKRKIIVSLVYSVFLMSVLYYISLITKTAPRTYLYSIYKDGWKGWSVSSHYLGHCLLLTLPIALYALFEKQYINKWYKYIILIALIVPCFYLVGTKAPLFGTMAIMGFYSFMLIIQTIFKKRKISFDSIFIIVITTILASTFTLTFGYRNFNTQMDVYNKDNTTAKEQINTYINDKNLTESLEKEEHEQTTQVKKMGAFEKRLKKAVIEFKNVDFSVFDNRTIQIKLNTFLRSISPINDKLFGYGYHTMINCLWVETDTFSIFFSFGLIGFLLIIFIPVLFLGISGIMCLINYKKMNSTKFLLGFGLGIGLFLITFVGYTVMFSQTVFYLIMLLIVSNYIFKEEEYKDKRKYLFMINDLNVGGAEVGLVDVLNELSKTETVDLVLLRKEGELLNRLNKNIRVYSILNKDYSKLKNKIYHIFYFLGGIFTKYVYSNTINTEYEVEVAYLEGFPAVFIASSTNPYSIKIASIRVGIKNHKLKAEKVPFGMLNLKLAYNKMDKIYGVSKQTTLEFIERFKSCKEKTTTIYTYFNTDEIIKKSNEVKDNLFDKDKVNFLAVGRFNHQKGYDRLIDAFEIVHQKYKNAVLHIIGKNDTELGEELKEKIKEKNLDNAIKLYGVISNPYPYMKQCDALISSSYYEGYPRVINEALALKKLCIGPKVTGMDEALDDGRLGILTENTTDALVDGMIRVIEKNDIDKYNEELKTFDGNKSHFFESFNNLITKKEKMIIYFPKLSYGGMEKSLVNLINKCDLANKYDLTLYLIYKGKNNYLSLLPNNMKIILACKGEFNLINKVVAIFNISYRYLYSLINKYDISISYAYQHPLLTTLTRLSSKNNIMYIHSNLKDGVDKKILNKRIKRCKYQKFNKIICVSKNAKNTLVKLINRKDKIYVINNPIDGERIINDSKEAIDDFKFESNTKYFINICRQEEDTKKLTRIINATEKLNKEKYNFEVLLIGDGKSHEYYKDLIKEKNIKNIHLLGRKTNPYKYLLKSDALILSSIREGYPVVYSEAMILNKPIITTSVSDSKEDIEGKYGIVVNNDDNSIYEGMKKFLEKEYKIKNNFDYIKFNNDIKRETYKVFSYK